MRQLISFKNLGKFVLSLGISISVLFACNGSSEIEINNRLNDLYTWNNVDSIKLSDAITVLQNGCMYFKIDSGDPILERVNGLDKIHAYAAYSNNSINFYLIPSVSDTINSDTGYNFSDDLLKYEVQIFDTNRFKGEWDTTNIHMSNNKSNITREIAWNRVNYWNNFEQKRTWIEKKYAFNSSNDTIKVLNPIFSVFEINASDLDPLKDHYCFLAVGADSINPKSHLGKINADLIIVNIEEDTQSHKLMYNVQDLVHTIPPCKKNNSQCNVPKYGVLQKIITNRMP